MMGKLMATTDVKQELNRVQVKLAKHEQLHEASNKTLDKVSEAVINQVRISEQIVALDRRHVDSAKAIHKRLDNMDVKVDKNHTQITRWGGAITAAVTLLSVAGFFLSVYKTLV